MSFETFYNPLSVHTCVRWFPTCLCRSIMILASLCWSLPFRDTMPASLPMDRLALARLTPWWEQRYYVCMCVCTIEGAGWGVCAGATYTYIRTYTHTHTYTYTRTHTRTYVYSLLMLSHHEVHMVCVYVHNVFVAHFPLRRAQDLSREYVRYVCMYVHSLYMSIARKHVHPHRKLCRGS